ncbi:MAG: LysR family transcriptional regulator [Candidatus Fimivivens sp.]
MTLRELKVFVSVYENQSISKAAERLYMTQPTLTRVIQNIENDVGAQLFKRTRNGIILTVAGEIYMENAKKMIAMYRHLEISLAAVNTENRGKLVIGSNFFLGACVLPCIVSEFEKRFPNIELTIIEGTSTEIENEISKGIIDIGVIHLPVQSNSIEAVPIGQERFFIALPSDDALATMAYYKEGVKLPYLDIKLLKERHFVVNHPTQHARKETERICKLAGFSPKVKFQTRNIQTIAKMVGRKIGVSLIPSSYIMLFSDVDKPDYFHIEEAYRPEWRVAVIYEKTMPLVPASKTFIEICTEVLPHIYNM